MTSPPPSETGATAEDDVLILAAIEELRVSYFYKGPGRYRAWWAEDSRAILATLVSAAKRSAHLEDARAVCKRCREQGPPVREEEEEDASVVMWWHALPVPAPGAAIACDAWRIWDALSRTGAK